MMFGRKKQAPVQVDIQVHYRWRYGITRLSTGYEYVAVKIPMLGSKEMPATTLERGIKGSREQAVNAARYAIANDKMATDARGRTEWKEVR